MANNVIHVSISAVAFSQTYTLGLK